MLKGIITFVLVILINIFYTYYLHAVQQNKPLIASTWSTLINLAASIAAINYVENHWVLIPSCAGSFIGTYVGMIISVKR